MDKSILSKVFIFAVGAAIGSAVTWKFVKTKYEKIANEEIESVKEIYGAKRVEKTEPDSADTETNSTGLNNALNRAIDTITASDLGALTDITERYSYTAPTTNKKEDKTMFEDMPYVIPPDEFGELDDYNTISLTYYADGVLTDEDDEPIDDFEEIIGEDSLSHFGEYEEDSVFVRNDSLRTDYEILKDVRRYRDI